MTKRETCRYASPAPIYQGGLIVGRSGHFSECAASIPRSAVSQAHYSVGDVACERCECWMPKCGPTIAIHCICCGQDATVAAVLVPANSQKICDSCAANSAAEGGE